jgi:hypothetical protein
LISEEVKRREFEHKGHGTSPFTCNFDVQGMLNQVEICFGFLV